MKSRAVSSKFLHDLKDGMLSGLTERVRQDDTLMLALRGSYIDIYYRGGRILNLTEKTGRYEAKFDINYANGSAASELSIVPPIIASEEDCAKWLIGLPQLKEVMNRYFSGKKKLERESQQLVTWENNRSKISNETEYFITDIEYTDGGGLGRWDMLGLKWPAKDRKTSVCRPVFIEMKYGDSALDGSAGLQKHMADFVASLSNEEKRINFSTLIADQFNQLDQIGLFKFEKSKSFREIQVCGRPEVIIILANTNPRSGKLKKILDNIHDVNDFDLRFFVSNFAGYGMHDHCMLTLDEFRQRLALVDKGHP